MSTHVHIHFSTRDRKAKDDDPKIPHAFIGPMSAMFCARCGMPRSAAIHTNTGDRKAKDAGVLFRGGLERIERKPHHPLVDKSKVRK